MGNRDILLLREALGSIGEFCSVTTHICVGAGLLPALVLMAESNAVVSA